MNESNIWTNLTNEILENNDILWADIDIRLNNISLENFLTNNVQNLEQLEFNWEIGVFSAVNTFSFDFRLLIFFLINTNYSKCSRRCDTGLRIRQITCRSSNTHEEVDDTKCAQEKPVTFEKCFLQKCIDWSVTKWSPVSIQTSLIKIIKLIIK